MGRSTRFIRCRYRSLYVFDFVDGRTHRKNTTPDNLSGVSSVQFTNAVGAVFHYLAWSQCLLDLLAVMVAIRCVIGQWLFRGRGWRKVD